MTEQTIPVVDLQDFLRGTKAQRDDFVATTGDALVQLGFFALEGHGVDSDLIQQAYDQAEEFFLKSESEKKSFENAAIKGQRGYTSFGREHAKGNNNPDLKEFWHVGRSVYQNPALAKEYPQNIWPSFNNSFKPVFSDLFNRLDVCSLELLKACSLYIGQPADYFSDMAQDGNSILRIIHYPPIDESMHPSSIRAAAHEDINLITLLCESTASGLELLENSGKWRPIPSIKGQIIVDAGDMLQNVTNGYFKSTTHRVVNPGNSRERRFSMPFFVHPRSEIDLTPDPYCVGKTGGKPSYRNITAGQFLQQRLAEIGLS